MSPVAEKPRPTLPPARRDGPNHLRATPYDNVASVIIALLVLVGTIVTGLVVIWFSRQIGKPPIVAVPVVLEDLGGGGREDGVIGESMELDAPPADEIGQEAALPEPQVQDTLALVGTAVAAQESELYNPAITDELNPIGGGKLHGDGRRIGRGSGEGGQGIARGQRWEILFKEGSTLEDYARQLDFFHIELGVIGGTNQVIYVSNLTKSKPDVRVANGGDEKRLYMSWRQGSLQEADRSLVLRAGVEPGSKIIVHFYSPEVENKLAQLEAAHRGKNATQIRRTRFGVKSVGNGFDFFVIDQTLL